MAHSSNEIDQTLSRSALIALVIGSMVGSGIFALPAAFARATGALGAMIAWIIAGTGMLMLAFVFQALSRRRPDLDACKTRAKGGGVQTFRGTHVRDRRGRRVRRRLCPGRRSNLDLISC